MHNRRSFLKHSIAATGALGATTWSGSSLGASSTQSALVFDAMGEIREVYDSALLREMLDSGLNAITKTMCDPKTYEREALDVALEGIRSFDAWVEANPRQVIKATSVADLDRAQRDGKIAVFYLIQNSTPFGKNLDMVDTFYGLGLRSVQVTYNYQNWAGAGCLERTNAGLSKFGVELVEKLNDTNMLVDCSHANMPTMADTIRTSKMPVIVSHTGCLAIHKNVRNTTDENLRLLADHGGVVGIDQIRPHITTLREGALQHYLDHIQHAVKVCGIDHVGIGSDRDHRYINLTPEYLDELRAEQGANLNEDDLPWFMVELNGPRRMETIWSGLKDRGLSDADVEKIMGANVRRIYAETIG
ncbi:MAG: membrane dipeptidase [Proteobacteria bacterium]|nr:membrane dipeptidase [Pseudomonadota bacterium]MDA0992640.1 membrane dipeptidase [Pseudomonadota bacterium]